MYTPWLPLPMIDIAARFGDNLARHCKLADLSQEELAHPAELAIQSNGEAEEESV